METLPLILSSLLFLIFGSYLFFGCYIILVNSKEKVNRMFFVLCLFLSIGVFGFAISLFVSELEASLFWRRVSSLGWGTFPGILLHFFLVLTNKERILKKWWVYFLLYIPAGVCIYIFSLSHDLALMQYNFVKTPLGWISMTENNNWAYLYLLYFYGSIFISLALLWNWKKHAPKENDRKQASLIFYGFVISLIIDLSLELFCHQQITSDSLQMSPNIMFVAMLSIFYSIKKYKLTGMAPANNDEDILNDITRSQIYNYLSACFIAGSFLNIISQYSLEEKGDLMSILQFSGVLLVFGGGIQIVQRIPGLKKHQDNIILLMIVLAIPLITFEFINVAGLTVWAFPFILILIFLVFNNRIALVGVTISIFLTQIFVFLTTPQVIVEIDSDDHVVRMGLFGIAIWVAFFINQLYILRLKKNAEQMKIQKIISDFSTDFVNVNAANFDEKIWKWLTRIGEMFDLSRACICFFNAEKTALFCSQEWCNDGEKSFKASHQNILVDEAPEWIHAILDKKIVHFMEYREATAEKAEKRAGKAEEALQNEALLNKVQISIPISCKGAVCGFLSLHVKTKKDKLNHEYKNLFEIVENILTDAMLKVEAEKEINHRAYYDQLTDIPNRLLFSERLTQEIKQACETGKMIGIIFLDIDNFKNVNDTMGHEGGDQLLKLVSQKLVKTIKKTDTVSRFAGDEFMIMLTNISREREVVNVVNRIRGHFKNEFKVNEQNFYLSASLGVAMYPTDGHNAEELIKSADIAMYKAKERGKNRYVLCSPHLKEEIRYKNDLLGSLHEVMERKELTIHYQPQVCLTTGRIIAVEALLRWQHPKYKMVSPKTMIPLAEQTGMINPIGEWVLRTACHQNRQWQNMGLPQIRVAVNMSATQFRNPKLNGQIMRILKETDLRPKYLELELTENIAINKSDYIVGVLSSLKKLGVFISIDDFGTEYSSLSRLKMLPIDQLKMDKQFVDGLAENEKDQAIANTIILLAKNLGLYVIAEGVETEAQINFLREHECNSVQGFYYYQPMPAEEIESLLKSQKNQLVLLK